MSLRGLQRPNGSSVLAICSILTAYLLISVAVLQPTLTVFLHIHHSIFPGDGFFICIKDN